MITGTIMRARSWLLLVGAVLAGVTFAHRTYAVRPDRTTKCEAAKVLAAGKRVAGDAGCHQKALLKSVDVSPACLAKVDKKFRAAVAKADGVGSCAGSADDLATGADDYLTGLLGGVAPSTTSTTAVTSTTVTTVTTTTLPVCSVVACNIDTDCGDPACGPCVGSICLGFTP